MATKPSAKWDCETYAAYWEERGEDPHAPRPIPWWQRMGEKKPEPPRRLQRRVRDPKPADSSPRRKLVRVGALRQNAATAPRSAAAPEVPPGGP
jgi:hypothetical protein